MADEKRYSVEEAAKELRTGVSTLLLWQHIYSEFLTSPGEEGDRTLTREDIHLFTYISECTESGLTREEIRQALRNRASGQGPLFSRNAFRKDEDEDILSLLDEENPTPALLARLVIQQRRLADAEERKASAQERRLAIEEEKTKTLSAILATLKTSGIPLAAGPGAGGGPPIALPQEPAPPAPPEAQDKLPALAENASSEDMDDLSALVGETPTEEMDDLSALVGEAPTEEMDDLSALVGETPAQEMDDLSALVRETPAEEMDDLSALVGEGPAEEMDDLSALVGGPTTGEPVEDLWNLVGEKAPEDEAEKDLDNLRTLVDETPQKSSKKPMSDTGLDDLWILGDEPVASTPEPPEPAPEPEDLWNLVGTSPDHPESEPEPTPPAPSWKKEEAPPYPTDPEAYKDFILKEIIGMKRREGLSAAQVAARLNAESKPTFSGKTTWGVRTIEGIFRIIEKAGPS